MTGSCRSVSVLGLLVALARRLACTCGLPRRLPDPGGGTCLNNADPRLPSCSPTDVATYTVSNGKPGTKRSIRS